MADLTRIESKIDKLDDRLDGIDKILVKQETNLALHMKRSDALEAQIKPLQTHVDGIGGILKGLGLLGLAISILAGIVKILEFFSVHPFN